MLAACGNEKNVLSQTPGVYKGKDDPLLSKQQDTTQQQLLKERLYLIQADR